MLNELKSVVVSSDIVSDALTAAACSCFWIFSLAAVIASPSKYLSAGSFEGYFQLQPSLSVLQNILQWNILWRIFSAVAVIASPSKYLLKDIFPNQLVLLREAGGQIFVCCKIRGTLSN